MRDNYVYFAGKMLSDFDMFVTNAGVYNAPARNYESISIAGRSGNLLFENDKFDNIEYRYPAVILSDFNMNFEALKGFLLSQTGYSRLSDTFYPDEFYLATFKRFDNVKQSYLNGDKGTFVLVFERKPQRYLKNGEKKLIFTSNGSFKNPTQFKALPFITVYGSGTFTLNGISVSITTDYAHLDIDCELQEVLQLDGNLDITLTNGEFPKLKAGINELSFTGLSRIEIIPRWYTL